MHSVGETGCLNGADTNTGRGLYLRNLITQPTPVLTNIRVAGPASSIRRPKDRSGTWLRVAMAALAVLAVTAAVVSYQAQFRMVNAYKADRIIAGLQAAIPDVAALVFAALGIALALHGKRAIRSRLLNVAAVGTSIYMNALASSSGWKALSIWVLAPVAYAVTSDTLIGVLRAYTVARQKALNETLDDDESTPMAVVGKILLYLLRFAVAAPSTASGLRRWILLSAPVPDAIEAPSAKVIVAPVKFPAIGPPKPTTRKTVKRAGTSKKSRLIELAAERRDLVTIPQSEVSALATELSAEIDLSAGTARRELLGHVRQLQSGGAA